ncbi:MAG: Re/Si-specific NAD(P)(+) transhydrogenase subunit alpha [Myxococcota bacterium]
MKVAIPREVHPDERRVAATPETTGRLRALGFDVWIEKGAGSRAGFLDEAYEAAGAEIIEGTRDLWASADMILKVRAPMHHADLGDHEADLMHEGQHLVSFFWPAQNEELVERLAERKVTVFAMDQIPRITRAQKMDALSSMANIAGYRAVLEAAFRFGSFFTGQITAAGRVPPAKVLVIGAGVAGLQAIATARSMGAVVRAFDTRLAVKEQVQSLGAEFLELEFEESGEGEGGYAKVMSEEFLHAEMELFEKQAPEVDIVITTALIPGKPAPKLWTRHMVEDMRPGSVVVDLASEQGGNCELTQPGQVAEHNGVTLVGFADMPSRLPKTASELYGSNLAHLLEDMVGDEGYVVDLEDEVVRGCIVLRDGEKMWPPPPKPEPKPEPAEAKAKEGTGPVDPEELVTAQPERPKPAEATERAPRRGIFGWVAVAALAIAWGALKVAAPEEAAGANTHEFLQHLTVFVLSCFVGWQVIWNVTAALHTPLMSVTNAISGIIIVGGLLHASGPLQEAETMLGLAAVLFATINVAGGFLVTQRMLRMFRKD